jgi:hypothetical protein
MADLNPQPLPPGRAIRVSAPASVLYDLDAFQRALASILGQTGCRTCTSGMNFIWETYSEFAVDRAGQASPVVGSEGIAVAGNAV